MSVFRDNLRHFVSSVNASRTIRIIQVWCRPSSNPFNPQTLLSNLLRPLEHLRCGILLALYFLSEGGQWVPFHALDRDARGFPSDAQRDYLQDLRTSRTYTDIGEPIPCLIDEWIHLRAWLHSILPQLRPGAERVRADNLDMQHQMRFDHIQSVDVEKLRELIVKAWKAHDKKDKRAFKKAKEGLVIWWGERCQEKVKLMLEGAGGPEAVSEGASYGEL